jgi:hypothetical protein
VAKLILYEKSLYDEAIDFGKIGKKVGDLGRSIQKKRDDRKKAKDDKKNLKSIQKNIKNDAKTLKKKTGAWSQFKAGLKGGSVFDDMSEADLVKHAIHLKKGDLRGVAAYLASNESKFKDEGKSALSSKFQKARAQFEKAKSDENHPMNKYIGHVQGKGSSKDVRKVTDLDKDGNEDSSKKKSPDKKTDSKKISQENDLFDGEPKAKKVIPLKPGSKKDLKTGKKKEPDKKKSAAAEAISKMDNGETVKFKGKYYSKNQAGKIKKFDAELDADKWTNSSEKGTSLTKGVLSSKRLYNDLKEIPKDKKDLPDNFKYKDKYFSRNKDGEIKAFEKKEAADHWAKSNSRKEEPEKKDLKKSSSDRPHLKLLKNKPTNEDIKNFKMEM